MYCLRLSKDSRRIFCHLNKNTKSPHGGYKKIPVKVDISTIDFLDFYG